MPSFKELFLGLTPPAGAIPSIYMMPLSMYYSEIDRIQRLFTVAFFKKYLIGENSYSQYLNRGYAQAKLPSFVRVDVDNIISQDHPVTIQEGDKITFTPVGPDANGQYLYQVQYSQGNALVSVDATHIRVGFPIINTPGTSFPFLENNFGNTANRTAINYTGAIILGLKQTLPNLSGNAIQHDILLTSPYVELKNTLIGSGINIIAPFYALPRPLPPPLGAPDSAVTYKETADGRLIVTWNKVYPVLAEESVLNVALLFNIDDPSTYQAILYGNTSSSPGKIEFIYGKLSNQAYTLYHEIAAIGIAKGNAWANYPIEPIGDKEGTAVDFPALTSPVTLPVEAIYQSFTAPNSSDKKDKVKHINTNHISKQIGESSIISE